MNNANNEERLQKALARAGIASRRACEELIAAGRVKVNGKIVTQLGTKVDPSHDKVTVDDHPIAIKPTETPKKIYLMLNKPEGYLSTVTDPQGRPTIMDLVETDERLYPVGRLDADTTGLLLLTNDGAFAHALTHPRYSVEKEYLALIDGRPPLRELETLRKGVNIPVENPATGEIEEQKTRPAKVELVGYEGSNTLIRFIIKEGKKRQVRLMAQVVGLKLLELKRVRFGPVPLADLPEGETRPLSKIEIKRLLEAANSERETVKIGPGNARPRSMARPAEGKGRDKKSSVVHSSPPEFGTSRPAKPGRGRNEEVQPGKGPKPVPANSRYKGEERTGRQKPAAPTGPKNKTEEKTGRPAPAKPARPFGPGNKPGERNERFAPAPKSGPRPPAKGGRPERGPEPQTGPRFPGGRPQRGGGSRPPGPRSGSGRTNRGSQE
jgi:pseudouridine synthase